MQSFDAHICRDFTHDYLLYFFPSAKEVIKWLLFYEQPFLLA